MVVVTTPAPLSELRRTLLERRLRGTDAAHGAATTSGPRASTGDPFPAGPVRLWREQVADPDTAALNVGVSLGTDQDLDPARLRRALTAVARAHEALRALAVPDGPEAIEPRIRYVDAEDAIRLTVHDLRDLRGTDADERLTRRRAEIARGHHRRPFAPATETPLRVALIREPGDSSTLVLTAHHMAWDDDSWEPFLRDLTAAWDADGTDTALPERPSGLAARPARSAGHTDAARAHWAERLHPLPDPPVLPGERPGDGDESSTAGRIRVPLPADLRDGLADLAREAGVTTVPLLLAIAGVVLARHCDTEDLLLATPVVTRDGNRGIGYFGNTLPIRVRVDADANARSVREHIGVVGALWNADLTHSHLGVDEIVSAAALGSRRGRDAVRIGISTRGFPALPAPGGGDWRVDTPESAEAQVAVDIALVTEGTDVSLEITHRIEAIDADAAGILLRGMIAALTAAAADPDAPLLELPVTAAADLERLVGFEHGDEYPVSDDTLVDRLRRRAGAEPDAVAIIRTAAPGAPRTDDTVATIGDVVAAAEALAARLHAAGVSRGDRVALCLRDPAVLAPAACGVLTSGAAYVPVDPTLPDERFAFILGDSGVRAVVADADLAERIRAALGDAVVLLTPEGTEETTGTSPIGTATPAPPRPEDAAYVIYTSGTTGLPKGVVVPHRAIVDYIDAIDRDHDLGGETLLQVASTSFDVSVGEIFGCLTTGATLVVPAPGALTDPAHITDLITTHGITSFHMVPSLLGMMLTLPDVDDWRGLRRVPVGGEALPGEVADAAARKLGVEIVNFYGPTEATLAATSFRVVGEHGPGTVPIGHPLANNIVRVLDRYGRRVPPGTPGEIFIGGTQLADGYLDRPALTAERFRPDPFAPGARLYRTGDLARWNPAGALEFLGRLDEQVKIRGLRVELGEIVSAVRAHPGVADAAVAVIDHPHRGTVPVAWAVPVTGDEEREAAAVLADLRHSLPAHMIPESLRWVTEIPVTANGKLDRAALPAPDLETVGPGRPPTGELETTLCALFSAILGREVDDVDASFFDLGGHSLLATRLASRIRAEIGVDLPVRVAFDDPTPAGIAAWIEANPDRRSVPLTRRPADAVVPLTAVQRRMWLVHRASGGRDVEYNVPIAASVRGPLDEDALHEALRDLLAAHPILRTVYPEVDGLPTIHVLDVPENVLEVVAHPGTDLDGILTADADHQFDLTTDIPFRARLHRVGDADPVLSVVVHHIATDAVSSGVLLEDLQDCYVARAAGRRPELLDEDRLEYADLAVADATDSSTTGTEAIERAVERLRGLPADTAVRADRPAPVTPDNRGANVPIHVPADVVEAVTALGRSVGATPFTVLIAAVAALLRDHGAGTDIPLGTPVTRRHRPGTERLVGCLIDTAVVRLDLTGDPSAREIVSRGSEAVTEALASAATAPFDAVVEGLGVGSAGSNPLFGNLVVLREPDPETLPLDPAGGTALRLLPFRETTAKFDLTVDLRVHEDGWRGVLNHRVARYDRTTVRRIARRLVTLLRAWGTDPDAPTSARPTTDTAELDHIRAALTGPDEVPGTPDTVAAFLAAAPDVDPNATAVVVRGRHTTHGELRDRTNVLVAALLAAGIGPGRIVALATERGVDAVAGLVAIMRCGAIFMPVDARLPEERLRTILGDASPDVILGHASILRGLPLPVGTTVIDAATLPASDPAAASATPRAAAPSDGAYLLYTSGSTGTPKGVLGTQRAVAARVFWQDIDHPGPADGRADVRLIQGALAFLDPGLEILAGLAAGAELVVADDAEMVDLEAVAALLHSRPVTQATAVCGVTDALLRLAPDAVARTHRWVSSGEPLTAGLLERLRAAAPTTILLNAYGTTETAGSVIRGDVTTGPLVTGLPVRGTRIRLVDDLDRDVPVGVAGEVVVHGPQVARGYLGRPDLTADRFRVSDPGDIGHRTGSLGHRTGSLGYRTGDLARLRPDGMIEFVGRRDHRVKVNGQLVDLGEVEAALRGAEDVRAAAAVLRGDSGRIAAYVVADSPAAAPDPDRLLAGLRRRLPAYAVPATIDLIDAIPTTGSGKTDRNALPDPLPRAAVGIGGPPRAGTERALAALVAEIIGVEAGTIGREDGFFALGGDSVLALRLVTAAGEHGLAFTVRDVFERQTVAGLAEVAASAGSADARGSAHAPDAGAGAGAGEPSAPMSASGLDDAALADLAATWGTR